MLENAILIAGPTASGKSATAARLAKEHGGVVVNADSMQVYELPRLLTAQPDADAIGSVPHLLYGHVDPAIAHSTGAWLRDVEALADAGHFAGRRPVFVGGTGLYFRALLQGMSPMPAIAPAIREQWRRRLEMEGAPALHAVLAARDPAAAASLASGDGQRILRALEVLEASGRSIREWQAEPGRPLVDMASARLFIIEPDRAELVRRIEGRFDAMMEAGAIGEVAEMLSRGLDRNLPAMKAIGVPELAAVLEGRLDLREAATAAKAATRRYAKRQSTWFRNQCGEEWARVEAL